MSLILGLSSFITEAVGILAALTYLMQSSDVTNYAYILYSDSKGLISQLNKDSTYNSIFNLDFYITAIKQMSSKLGVDFRWIRSHPERRQPDPSKWTFQETGNALSDLVATGDLQALRRTIPTFEAQYHTYTMKLTLPHFFEAKPDTASPT